MGLLDVPYQIYIFVAKLFGLFFLFVHGIAFRMWNYGIKPALSKEDAKSLGDVNAMSVVEHAAKVSFSLPATWTLPGLLLACVFVNTNCRGQINLIIVWRHLNVQGFNFLG